MKKKAARKFPDMPNLDIKAKDEWVLEADYTGPEIDGKRTVIKAGLITDGGSIPMAGRAVVGSKVRYPNIAAYVLHDGEYMAELYPRKECDIRMKIALERLGVSRWQVLLIYRMVRIFGYLAAWRKHTGKSVKAFKKLVFNFEQSE
jgi:hypothetical protein